MCGISGLYRIDDNGCVDTRLLVEMTRVIRHRGPDDEGFLLVDSQNGELRSYSGEESAIEIKQAYPLIDHQFKANLAMGFRRLATLELSINGHQPMSLKELDLHICFNGEIYNYIELMDELSNQGYTFRGHSDAEVILKAYDMWGEDCVSRFIGMWSFVIWDGKRKRLFASRDRFGIKPLYYAYVDGILYWGSEIKQLLLAPIEKNLNQAMIWRSMKINSLLVYDDETYWDSIHVLKPGYIMIVENGYIDLRQYYTLDINCFESYSGSLEDATDEYRSIFLDSLKLQLRSDVEIAASLSGGMDSSAIVCSAFAQTGKPMQTFSSYYAEDPAMDERLYIKLIAEQTGARAHYLSPGGADAAAWFEQVTYFNDLPTRSGYTSQWAVMQAARQKGIKVLLSGQGSDEISAGYKHSAYRYFADILLRSDLKALRQELPAYLRDGTIKENVAKLGKIALSAMMPESSLYKLEFDYYRFEPFNKDFTFNATMQAEEPILAKIHDIKSSRLMNFLYNMLHSTSLQTLLHLEDRMSSANSVESRVPFLDHRLVDFSFKLPAQYKIKAPIHKYIHRLAMKDIVPREIYERKDKGIFSSPFYSVWMKRELKPLFSDILTSSSFRTRGIWNLPRVYNNWQAYLKGDNRPAEMLFNVIALELWFRKFTDNQ